ncbi:GntR family transcriptional regulator [Puteibacter caeruleilacunae]|nr:GntR family transcriptional regulator [Puteibacter caeruleilacunae]
MLKTIFSIDENSSIPKYRQLINSIIEAIESKTLRKGDKIPSLNQVCKEFGLSRDTVMVAFNELKSKGILSSMPGKGYYIENENIEVQQKILVLFDELNVFKEDLYNSFLQNLEKGTTVDIFFHHFNYQVFRDLIHNNIGKYTDYVIMPATFEDAGSLISKLPQDRVYILDRLKKDLSNYPIVYQDFENDTYDAMVQGKNLLTKYEELVMIFPGGKEPRGRVKGFERFCKENKIKSSIIKSLNDHEIKAQQAYFVPTDRNLVRLVKAAKSQGFELGKDFGIVSFNDTALKEVVEGGITTISTDFVLMGRNLAHLISEKHHDQVKNPSYLIKRASL